jgi:ABC-type glycerol-3-phosphate transport system permease component
LHTALLIAAAISLIPFLWLACASVKTSEKLFEHPFLPWAEIGHWITGHGPCPLTSDNYIQLFAREPFLRWMWNSLFLSATQTVLTVVLGSMGGFALAKYSFPGKRLIMGLMVLTMLLPSQVLLPSTYELMYRLGWVNSYLAILVPAAVSVFGIFLFRQAMTSVPDELLLAARVDGCSELRLWWDIAMPVVRPMTGAYTLMSFLAGWNSYLWPQVVLQDEGKFTLPLGLANMAGMATYQGNYGILMAGTLLSLLPVIALFFWLQNDFVAGLTEGALKG